MHVELAYGDEGLKLTLPDENVTVIEPEFVPGLEDEEAAFLDALRHPIGTQAPRELIKPSNTVAIVFSDITRPVPNDRILPWLLRELDFISRENITLIVATGTHRPNTREDLKHMLGEEMVENYRIINHDTSDQASLTYLGESSFGSPIWINSHYVEADLKILTGFIEPHLISGFSGGPKSVLPGIAGMDSIMHNHSGRMISHPKATWGVMAGNPIHEEILEVATFTQPDFIVNVTTNRSKEITGIYAGEMVEAHLRGVDFARRTAMRPVSQPFDIVITTNSGYPLDLNLYQSVKGMSTAAQIVRKGGNIIIAAECREGIPEYGNYRRILHMCRSPQEVLDLVTSPGFSVPDQWEAQLQAQLQMKADIYVHSSLPEEEVRRAHLLPCSSIEETLSELMKRCGSQARIAVLPQGPMTIPYIAN